ncbi:MAG: cytochrome b/b6 domain protein [Ilumatobacteraceae bacterium]|nr:cytochrome b/b6 domain protein [Ilumatobacteraceae bacterium]
MIIKRFLRWTDDRIGGTKFTRKALDKVFPDHWSFMLGEVALYCLMVLIATGVYLTFFFHASAQDVVYTGSYGPLRGQHMSEAYRSVVGLGFDVRAGLLIRQVHHWAALVFLGAIVLHLCRIYFTGAYRRPREINWFIGLALMLLAIANGFTGYSLPDDLLSGTGLRIAYSVLLSVPVIGTWMAYLAFGGEFPANDIISRLYVIHVLIVPALIVGLLSVHLAIVWRQKHTQFRGPDRTEDNVVGSRLWPTYAMRSIGLLLVVVAVLAALGGLVQLNPIWLYGPYQPASVSTAAQPDWYMGWLEGALRLFPSFRIHLFGYRVPEAILPAVVFPTLTFAILFAWPAVDRRLSGEVDGPDHHLLVRPRERPRRTALGVAVLTFYVVLFIGGGQDIISQKLHIALDTVTVLLRILLIVAPIAIGALAWRLCRDLAVEPPPGDGDPDDVGRDGGSDGAPDAQLGGSAARRSSTFSSASARSSSSDASSTAISESSAPDAVRNSSSSLRWIDDT